MNKKHITILIGILLAVLGADACSRGGFNGKSRMQSSSRVSVFEENYCPSDREVSGIENRHVSNEDMWRLVRYYSICRNDERSSEPWLKILAERGDPEAMVQLAAWLDVVGKRREAVVYAKRAKDMGYENGKLEFEALTSER